MRLILASASPRRRELLAAAGLVFEVQATDVDERRRPGESPESYVRRLAAEKSASAAETRARDGDDDLIVIGADTAVVVDEEILGKPETDREAGEMLRRLSARAHDVLTGLSLRSRTREVGCVETTKVWFSPLSEADVEWHVATGEGRDKAGGYGIQGFAARFIPRIEGSYSNVVGLPVPAVFDLLARLLGKSPVVASRE